MKIIQVFLLMISLAAVAVGQNLKISTFAGGGPWIGSFGFEDTYAGDYRRWQPNVGLGFEGELMITKSLGISMDLGGDLYFLNHHYTNAKDNRTVDSDLRLFYARIAAGLRVHPSKSITLGADFSNLAALKTSGRYDLVSYNVTSGRPDTLTFTDQFQRIRRPWIPGLAIMAGCRLPIGETRPIELRLSSQFALNGIFRPTFYTPFNPRPTLIRLDVVLLILSRRE